MGACCGRAYSAFTASTGQGTAHQNIVGHAAQQQLADGRAPTQADDQQRDLLAVYQVLNFFHRVVAAHKHFEFGRNAQALQALLQAFRIVAGDDVGVFLGAAHSGIDNDQAFIAAGGRLDAFFEGGFAFRAGA